MRKIVLVLALLATAMLPEAASAHAHLDHAVPAVGSTVATPPHDLTIWFTQNLEPAFSTVAVSDANGASVADGAATISANTMRVGLKALAAGTYKVHWHAVSVDTHTTEGDFTFTVGGQ
jgi:copper resistance protein C